MILAFTAIACSHSPTNTDLSDSTILNKPDQETLAQQADFISPPLDDSLKKNSVSAKDSHLIWHRLDNKFDLKDFYNHPRVTRHKEKYLNKNSYIAAVTNRSEPFFHYILSEIEARQMPAELAILPIVESGYLPRARSRARAVGLWQIMPFTASDLGLKRSAGYDGRHDVHASTSAALEYLTQMHNMFNGDWLLALAAYNAGPQRVKRALKKVSVNEDGAYDKDIYWDLHLPRETLNYVPRILALCSIINDRNNNLVPLHPIANEPYLASIQLSKRISPVKLIQTTAINETEIKLLNPAIRNLNTPIPAGYNLLVPKNDAKFLALAIENMEEAPQPKWAKHRISRGESLGGIAQRYGITINALRESNNLHNNKIIAGRTLTVPLQATTDYKHTHKKSKTSTRVENNYDEIIASPYMYVVAMGDSYWKIANRNNTTVKRLFEINGRSADQPLQPGETILVD
jgi:membrane-bound lytic murein transglycosylase D